MLTTSGSTDRIWPRFEPFGYGWLHLAAPVAGSISSITDCRSAVFWPKQSRTSISLAVAPPTVAGVQPVLGVPKSLCPSVTEKPLTTPERATATVSPEMASRSSRAWSKAFSFGISSFQPAWPVARSTCWRWVHWEVVLSFSRTPTTIFPFGAGLSGTPHSGVARGSFHFSLPSVAV
ncbi:hypothetical protein OOK25_26540 [Streptomyces sp. NBC_00347]|nr:hypothetical protein [Streptomyces sp. NBC_00347]MCX5127220.1 hypothetical protein [Streptomyces sp. NBC_00347]